MFDSEPFGQRAVRMGLATSEEVRQALSTQSMMALKSGLLGEILVEMGWLDPQDYMAIVQELVTDGSGGAAGHATMQEEFVRKALENGYIDEDRLEEARKIQSGFVRKNRLIGQVMVDMGFLSDEDRTTILETYRDNGR